MEKQAKGFNGFRNFAGKAADWAAQHPRTTGAAVGGVAGGGLSAAETAIDNKLNRGTKKKPKNSVGKSALLGGVLGAATGAYMGEAVSQARRYGGTYGGGYGGRRGPSSGGASARDARSARGAGMAKPPSWAADVKTKADAKKRFRSEALKHHPDRGGNAKKMQELNDEWDAFQGSHHFSKLSSAELYALFDEIHKIMENA